MGARQIVVVALLAAAGLVVVLAAVGLLAAGDQLPRLHFVTPVTSVAAPLTGAAYAVHKARSASGAGSLRRDDRGSLEDRERRRELDAYHVIEPHHQ